MRNAAEPLPRDDPLLTAARELAQSHDVSSIPPRAPPILNRKISLSGWIGRIDQACASAEPAEAKAAEWLLDNKYQIKRAVTQIRQDLPMGFLRRLPRLSDPAQKEWPRVFFIAQAFLFDTHVQVSRRDMTRFINAYQEEMPLTIAELWALPTMLRLVCLETLIVSAATLFPSLRPPFEERTSGHIADLHEPTESIARALNALRCVATISWKDFFDGTSQVEQRLQDDPAGVYGRMDFDTRDRYRKAIEELARFSTHREWDIVDRVLERAASVPADRLRSHVGYWLLSDGRPEFEKILGYRAPLRARLRRWLMDHAGRAYAVALTGVGIATLAVPIVYVQAIAPAPGFLIATALLCLIPATILSTTVVHWAVALLVPPRMLPKLDFSRGIESEFRTVVVVPVIVGSMAEVRPHLQRIELHHLADPDPLLSYVLLSDPRDASSERLPEDDEIEDALIGGIRDLNARHGSGGRKPFCLLHRARHFNPAQNCWMAWERKRGKLEQFNRLVLGSSGEYFPVREGDTEALRGCRFILTVDADTVLPPRAAAHLVGTLGHPLNLPELDPAGGRLKSGYTVIQPRVEISPDSGERTLFSYLYAGDSAIDIYSRAVSNVYQDLFGSAVYIGKGIYDVESFQAVLEKRIPQNTLLSHDLFEGAHGRVALASDIVLYDQFPTGYTEYMHRWHRWTRGDWQLLPWLFPRVPAADGSKIDNPLSGLDRWKIFDNLRRSIIPPALVALAAVGWLALPGNAWVWTLLTIAAPGAYLFTDVITGLARGRRRGAVRSAFRALRSHTGRWLLALVFLLQDAQVSVSAIGKTLWRLGFSRSKLLEWTSAAHTSSRLAGDDLRRVAWREMWPASAFAVVIALVVLAFQPASLAAAAILILAWVGAPEIAAWISRPRPVRLEHLEAGDREFLRAVARRTWLFFERFVGPEDHWLPPDNFQDDSRAEIAHRTSPTNIGMYLLSALTARDFGFLGSADLAVRVQDTLNTVSCLKHYRGHPLNWYDTRSLEPLEPRYVSTVDSGNLAVCLITLKEGCRRAASEPVFSPDRWDGLVDTLSQLQQALGELPAFAAAMAVPSCQQLIDHAKQARNRPPDWHSAILYAAQPGLTQVSDAIERAAAECKQLTPELLQAIELWLDRASNHVHRMRGDLDTLFPWLVHCTERPESCAELADKIAEALSLQMSLADVDSLSASAAQWLQDAADSATEDAGLLGWCAEIGGLIQKGSQAQKDLRDLLVGQAAQAEAVAHAMDFTLLYDAETRLFHIGYSVSSDRLDPHFYDLLASEARLASYFAIAKRDVPTEHWFFLGRPVARLLREPSLLSWNGSMFEYLMPSLLLRSSPRTLLAHSERAAVVIQRAYGRRHGMPWGVSESGYAARDSGKRYQYQAFGVPGLGLRRGLARDLVITPYASALALAVYPVSAARNLDRLDRLGATGLYGYLEAVDFTPERVPAGQTFSPVRSYMAHHQGMILAAIGNALHDDIHVRRFSSDLLMQTVHLLLQERIPVELPPERVSEELPLRLEARTGQQFAPQPWRPRRTERWPQMHLLGNGRIASWISDHGNAVLWWHGFALTRWTPDAIHSDHGMNVYLHDQDSDAIWSAGDWPVAAVPEDAEVVFHPHMAAFHRRDHDIAVRMEVAVAPGDDVEIRRITMVNESDRTRRLRLTTYAEVVLAPPRDHERHPAFSKLFVGSEYIEALSGLLFTRRPRDPAEHPPVLLHRVVNDDLGHSSPSYEADRRAFFGRQSGSNRPRGVVDGLTGSTGWTLDPVMALQCEITLQPRETRQVAFLTLVAGSRESVLELAERYTTLASVDWVLRDAAGEADREATDLKLEPAQYPELQSLASLLMVPRAVHLAAAGQTLGDHSGQPRLWALGISGDFPILVVRISDPRETGLLRTVLRAHTLWRHRSFHVDLVFLRMGAGGYEEPVRERVFKLIGESGGQEMLGRNGGIHLLFADHLTEDDRAFLEAKACLVLEGSGGALARQIEKTSEPLRLQPVFEATKTPVGVTMQPLVKPTDLQFENPLGGFSADGREYVIHLEAGDATPAPWCNVLANDEFGCITSESGNGFTWAINSGENRLTPWSNDDVLDRPGEVLYLRDEETAEFWTPTPAPAGVRTEHQIRHGAGYTKWRSHSHGLEQELLTFVARRDPVKIMRLRLRNVSSSARRITVTYYAEWLLGALPSVSRPRVSAWYDPACRAILACSNWNPEFSGRVAFLASSHPAHSLTTDRCTFLGREGNLAQPAGLRNWDLGGCAATQGDCCAAFQVHIDLPPDHTEEVVFLLGQGKELDHTRDLLEYWRRPDRTRRAFADVKAHWDRLLEAVKVKTPDPAFDVMVNRWLTYQTMASRVLGRAGFYQAGGAVGFRDQLQDILALLHSDPQRARAHIVDCAGRQFDAGDVLHWWHPPLGRGVRTRCSDDLLWLPYVTSRYVSATGDVSILTESIAFLSAPELEPQEGDRYGLFEASPERVPLFEHCARALERGVTQGAHGLPLMGAGDWNDGMNRVGALGRGESVWLGWFAIAVIEGFCDLARRMQREDLVTRWGKRAEALAGVIEQTAWDGDWYLRAFDDDGRPWGAAACEECRIDTITQSWSVLSGAAAPERTKAALAAEERELVDDDERIIRLLWPPFQHTLRDPGYIKAYPPGIRENGGQYSHAAAWRGHALAALGDGDGAWRVFDYLNPIRRCTTRAAIDRYRVEPYVLAADIASAREHVGRGGWTWYTGSAAWTWRLGVEGILGLRLENGDVRIAPSLPKAWGSAYAVLEGPRGSLAITIEDSEHLGHGRVELTVEDSPVEGSLVAFPTDGTVRKVHARLVPDSS